MVKVKHMANAKELYERIASAPSVPIKGKTETITSAIQDFDAVLERGQDYGERLQKLCNRVSGPYPAETTTEKYDGITSDTIIGEIQRRRQQLVYIMNWIESSLERLENNI